MERVVKHSRGNSHACHNGLASWCSTCFAYCLFNSKIMNFFALLFLVSTAQAANVLYLQDKPPMGYRDVTVITFYDPVSFTGFHTRAYETIRNQIGEIRNVDLYFHTAVNQGYADIQHGLAICFVRENHIAAIVLEWEEIKKRNPQPPSPCGSPFEGCNDLYDISENEEEETE